MHDSEQTDHEAAQVSGSTQPGLPGSAQVSGSTQPGLHTHIRRTMHCREVTTTVTVTANMSW